MSGGTAHAPHHARHAVTTPSAHDRWRRRRPAALALRAAMVITPVAASVAAMAGLSRWLPTPNAHSGLAPRLAWWAAVLIGSLLAMWATDRLSRKLAPLAALLDMAVLFPGPAPTRLRVARRVGDVRQLHTLAQQPRRIDPRGQQLGAAASDATADAAERILGLVGALRAHDRHTRGHSERVRVYTDLIAEQLRLPTASVDRLRWAALLHDIGKLRVPTTTLNKPAKLSSREWENVREHPAEGARLAAELLPWLGEWGRAIAEHHERFDGSGYPTGLQGREISLAGRIVAVADAFEVMTAPRAYKKAMTRAAALEEIVRFSGSQFDPDVVRAFLHVSAPRLRWAMGPTSWLVGTPLLGAAPSLTGAGLAAQAVVGVTTVAVASVTGLTAPAIAGASSGGPPAARPATEVNAPPTGSAATGHLKSGGKAPTAPTSRPAAVAPPASVPTPAPTHPNGGANTQAQTGQGQSSVQPTPHAGSTIIPAPRLPAQPQASNTSTSTITGSSQNIVGTLTGAAGNASSPVHP